RSVRRWRPRGTRRRPAGEVPPGFRALSREQIPSEPMLGPCLLAQPRLGGPFVRIPGAAAAHRTALGLGPPTRPIAAARATKARQDHRCCLALTEPFDCHATPHVTSREI